MIFTSTEHIQYTVYNSNDEGHYDWHVDMGPGKARRKLSLVCQLSDPSEYEGGELQINTGKGNKRNPEILWIEGPAFV